MPVLAQSEPVALRVYDLGRTIRCTSTVAHPWRGVHRDPAAADVIVVNNAPLTEAPGQAVADSGKPGDPLPGPDLPASLPPASSQPGAPARACQRAGDPGRRSRRRRPAAARRQLELGAAGARAIGAARHRTGAAGATEEGESVIGRQGSMTVVTAWLTVTIC